MRVCAPPCCWHLEDSRRYLAECVLECASPLPPLHVLMAGTGLHCLQIIRLHGRKCRVLSPAAIAHSFGHKDLFRVLRVSTPSERA